MKGGGLQIASDLLSLPGACSLKGKGCGLKLAHSAMENEGILTLRGR